MRPFKVFMFEGGFGHFDYLDKLLQKLLKIEHLSRIALTPILLAISIPSVVFLNSGKMRSRCLEGAVTGESSINSGFPFASDNI